MPRIAKKEQVQKTQTETTPKLKRPASAYILFSKDIRSKIVQENPALNHKDITKVIAQEWKSLNDNDKKKYIDMYSTAKKEYEEELKKQSTA